MTQKVRVRFAPSPTGPLHIGGVRTALYNFLFARRNNGTCILRVEDTDQARYVPGAEEYIIEAMKWLGFEFDEGPVQGGPHAPYRQSERKAIYRQYAERMVAEGNAYYAFDTPEELDEMRKKLEAARMPAKYDAVSRMSMKNSLTLPSDDVKKRLENGDEYVIRIKLPRKEEVRFEDMIRGWVVVNTSQMDDKVLLKHDGMPTYHLANVVDDYLMGISHVIRGEEWLPSAPLHVMLYRYLGWENAMPAFAHLSLILKPDGQGKLSKRDGDRLGFPVFPLQWKDPKTGEVSSGYRESGYLPGAVINMLAFLGWHPSDNREMFTLDDLIQEFDIRRVSKSGAKFDFEKAKWFNHKYLMEMGNHELAMAIRPAVEKEGWDVTDDYLSGVSELMKEKIAFIGEIVSTGRFFFEKPLVYDQQAVQKKWKSDTPVLLTKLADSLALMDEFSAENIQNSLNNVAAEANTGAGALMLPLRLAISGQAGGPPIFEMAELLGKNEVVERINAAVVTIGAGGKTGS